MAIGDPGTITFSTEAVGTGGSLGASGAAPQVGIQGGGVAAPSRVLGGADWFEGGMTAPDSNLPEFIQELVAPQLQRVKQQQAWDGFVAARSGVTMDQINEQQPWYTRVFGPTNFEIGAQTYTVQKHVADMESDILARMPELRKLSPEDMALEFNRVSQESMTGNGFADALMQKTFMDRAGPLMDLHTKERVAWQQAELVRSQVGAINSASSAYQNLMVANARLGDAHAMEAQTSADQQQAFINLMDTMQTSKYQTDGSIKEVIFSAVRGMADRGESYSIQALADAGMFNALEADDAQRLLNYIDSAESRNRNKWAGTPQAIESIARMQAMIAHGIGGEPAVQLATAINDQFKAETGAVRPYYDADQIGSFAAQGMKSYIAERNRIDGMQFRLRLKATDALAKEEAERENQTLATRSWLQGSWGNAVDMKYMERGDMERAGLNAFQQMESADLQNAANTVVYNYATRGGKVNNMLAERFKHDVGVTLSEQVSDAFLEQAARWKRIYDGAGYRGETGEKTDTAAGPATAAAYYGDAINDRMIAFHGAVRAGQSADLAYRMHFGEAIQDVGGSLRGLDSAESRANVAAVRAEVDRQDASWFDRWFGNGVELHPSTKAVLSNAAAYYWGKLPSELSGPDRARMAVQRARTEGGLEIAGAYAWVNGRAQQPISEYLRDNGELSGEVVNEVLRARLKASGASGKTDESIVLHRLPDVDGEPRLHALVYTADGVVDALITGEEIRKAYRNRATKDTTAPVPAGYYRAADGSIQPKLYGR